MIADDAAKKLIQRKGPGCRAVRQRRQQRHACAEDGRHGDGVDGADRVEDGPLGLHQVADLKATDRRHLIRVV